MKRLMVDSASSAVKDFLKSLPLEGSGVELELDGQIICPVLPPGDLPESAKRAMLERGRELVKKSRLRNVEVPSRAIEREVREAVDEVRWRK